MNGPTTDPDDPRLREVGPDGQQVVYLVLPAEERALGFVRPYRDTYRHDTCGKTTTMGRALSGTYARDPLFYGATYCADCKQHCPLVEFVWLDGSRVGS